MKTNFKTMTLTLASIALLSTSFVANAAAKKGADSGGGGGVYRVAPGKYLTPPEAGILISDKKNAGKRFDKYYSVKEETKKELEALVKKIKDAVPGISLNASDVLESRNTFIEQNVNPAQYEKIKAEYKIVFKKYGYKLEDEKFVLPAYSVSESSDGYTRVPGKTYILPDFDLLSYEQQAKILIHEFNMRKVMSESETREQRLRFALAVDVVINDIANGKDVLKIDLKNALRNFYKLKLVSDSTAAEIIFARMIDEAKEPIALVDVVLNEFDALYREYDYSNGSKIDPSLVQGIQDRAGLKENYAELLEGSSLTLMRSVNQDYVEKFMPETKAACGKIKDKSTLGKYVISKNSNNEFMAFKCFDNNGEIWVGLHKGVSFYGTLEFFQD